MDDRNDASLALSKLLLEQLSPTEIPLVDVLGPTLVEPGHQPAAGDGALGFGVGDVAWLVAVVPTAGVVVDILLDIAKNVTVDYISGPVVAWLGVLTGRQRKSEPRQAPAPLSPDVLARVHQEAYRQGLAVGLEDTRARLMADAVAGTLSMARA